MLYVGKARALRDRVRSYFQASRPAEEHKARMVEAIADLELVVTDSEMEALALENNLIKRHQPPYNVRLRDDKNHPYLRLTLAEDPRLADVEDGTARRLEEVDARPRRELLELLGERHPSY